MTETVGALPEATLPEATPGEAAEGEATPSEVALSKAALSDVALSEATLSEVALSEVGLSDGALSDAALSEVAPPDAAGLPGAARRPASGGRLASGRRLAPRDRRRQILDAARIMLETRPLEEVYVEAVADQIGVSPGLLFHYFGTQRKFRRAVVQAAARELLAQMAPDPALSPAGQLHAGLDTFAATVQHRPGLYLAVVRNNGDLSDLRLSIRAVLAEWMTAGLAQAGIDLTPALGMTVAGWLAFTEEALLSWVTQDGDGTRRLTRAELVALCERACFRLLESAIGDAEAWAVAERALRRR